MKLKEDERQEYIEILSLLKPVPKLGRREAKNIFEMQFAEVENMRRMIDTDNGAITAMEMFYDCSKESLMRYTVITFYHAFNYMLSQLEHIDNIERMNLNKKPKQEMIDDGIKELNRFGVLNTLDALAKDYGKSPLEVEQWSYGLVYSLMWKRRIESDIDDNRNERIKRKN